MPFKTILTVTGLEQENHDLELAMDFCAGIGAHLSILVLAIAVPPPIGEFPMAASDVWIQERQDDLQRLKDRTAAVSTLLAARGCSGDVTYEYPEYASTDETIGRRARYADLTLVGSESLPDGTLKDKAIEGALFVSGKPVLLLPKGTKPNLAAKRVAVAWDARLEAARAAREALDILSGADEVRLILVDPVEGEHAHGAEPGADLAAFLARHGVKAVVDRLPSEGHSAADVISRHALDVSADLLVMGAYGHARVRERIFGGVTRTILARRPLPVFMAR